MGEHPEKTSSTAGVSSGPVRRTLRGSEPAVARGSGLCVLSVSRRSCPADSGVRHSMNRRPAKVAFGYMIFVVVIVAISALASGSAADGSVLSLTPLQLRPATPAPASPRRGGQLAGPETGLPVRLSLVGRVHEDVVPFFSTVCAFQFTWRQWRRTSSAAVELSLRSWPCITRLSFSCGTQGWWIGKDGLLGVGLGCRRTSGRCVAAQELLVRSRPAPRAAAPWRRRLLELGAGRAASGSRRPSSTWPAPASNAGLQEIGSIIRTWSTTTATVSRAWMTSSPSGRFSSGVPPSRSRP